MFFIIIIILLSISDNAIKRKFLNQTPLTECRVEQVSTQLIHNYPYDDEYIIDGVATCTDKSIVMDLYCNGMFNKRGSTYISNDGSFDYVFEIKRRKCESLNVEFIEFIKET